MTTKMKVIIGFVIYFATAFVTAFAVTVKGMSGIGGVAQQATSNLSNIAKFITAASYVGGMGFAVGAVAMFKAHKDTPTQVAVSKPIVLLFIGSGLIFAPTVFRTVGGTMFGASGMVAGVSGITAFTKPTDQ